MKILDGKEAKRMKKIISIILVLIMVAAIAPIGIAESGATTAEAPINPDALKTCDKVSEPFEQDQIVTLIVKLKDNPVAARISDVNSAAATMLSSSLKAKQNTVESQIKEMLPSGLQMDVPFRYTLLFNGFAVRVPFSMKSKIASLPAVEKVFVSPKYASPTLPDTEPERLSTSVGFINADDAWSAGYTGKGTVIAIVDTGCVVAHNAFSTAPSDPKMSSDSISDVIANNNLQAESLYTGGTLSASTVYYSGKIPYRFNYGTGTNDVGHSYSQSDHGSHVAGIAAGSYSGSAYTGVAKDAQLAIMQVFGNDGGAEWSTIIAALEDCAYLEVDAVNMSLGSDLGYTSDSGETDAIFNLMAQHGINIACAAGNSGSSNGQQYYGSNYSYALAMNPDNGLVSSPGTYQQSLCVACCRKTSSSMVAFSSHGTTPDLRIKPEVSAPGYDIYAPTDPTLSGATTEYGTKSGTSMSSPHVAGAMALLTNYVSATWPSLTGQDKVDMVNRLLMCTANPVSVTSPRTQGSGIIDLQKAITTTAYINVAGCSRPKLELGDDPNKTGVYTLTFEVVNFGRSSLSFTPSTTVLTENARSAAVNSQSTYRLSGSSRNITSNCSFSGNGTITVPANSSKTVTITVTLNNTIKTELNNIFPNGIYIDGFAVLDGTVDLVVPFLGFYGSWSKASVFDRYTYIDEIQGINRFNVHTVQTEIGALTNGSNYMLFGANPYISSTDWWADRCTLSPNGDTYYDQIDKVLYSLVRNAGEGGLKIYNEDDPDNVYFFEDLSYMPKSWKYTGDSFYHSSDWIEFEKWAPDGLAEGTHVVFRLYHYLDYEGFDPAENECCEIVLPMTIDNTAPEVTYWKVDNGTLTVRVHDEHYAAWIGVYSDADCSSLITEQAITERTRGTDTDLTLSVGDHSTVYVRVGDYGRNTSSVFTLSGEGGSTEPVDITGMTLTPDSAELYVGNVTTLTVNKVPSNANNYEIEWTSSNPGVASTAGSKNSCTVTANAAGTAVITATANNVNGGETITASASITVSEFIGYVRADSVEVGAKYIIIADSAVSGNSGYAVGNQIVSNNHYLLPVSVTIDSADKIAYDTSIDFDAITWIPSGDASNGYVWQNVGNGKYLGLDSSEYLYPSTTSVAWLYDSNRAFNNQIDSGGYYYLSYSASSPNRYMTSRNPAAIRLYKLVEPTYFTVSFVDWDGTVLSSQTVEEGASAIAPADPIREGYAFTGWDKDFSAVTEDLTVTAQYEILRFRVTFVDWDGSMLKEQMVDYGDAATAPADPEREGYTFIGWDKDFTNVKEDLVITAQYEQNSAVTLLGDVNLDGTVDSIDALLVMRFAMSIIMIEGQGLINADLNADGLVNATDAIMIMRQCLNASILGAM